MVVIRIRFPKVWISAGLPTLSLEAYKLIIIKNCVQMLEEKFWCLLLQNIEEKKKPSEAVADESTDNHLRLYYKFL